MIIIETFERGCSPRYRPTARRRRNQDRHLMSAIARATTPQMPLASAAGSRPATTALAAIPHSTPVRARPSIVRSSAIAIDRTARTAIIRNPSTIARRSLATPLADLAPRSNPHSARGTRAFTPSPRFPPLEVFVRRPPEYVAPSVMGPASENLHNSGRSHRAKEHQLQALKRINRQPPSRRWP